MKMSTYMENYSRWRTSDKVDSFTKKELDAIQGDTKEIESRFASYLTFGTAGLRGTMVAGTNNMNLYTVAHATQGFANLINSQEKQAERGVIIAYDSRNHSEEFAKKAASVLAANHILVYLFDGIRPTPVLSFSIRELHCIAGINITASHNPKEYNGYKAYWEDGAQLSPEHAKIVSDSIAATDIFDGVKFDCFDCAVKEGKVKMVGKELDEKYLAAVLAQAVSPNLVKEMADSLKIVYTPLHGTGYKLVPEILSRIGLTHLYSVSEQMIADGNFPTVITPNPEYAEVFQHSIPLAEKEQADLIIATDPDADRVGVMIRKEDGNFGTLTGNQVGALLLDYIITALEEKQTVPQGAYVVKTIVTTELITKICEVHHLALHNVLTGFKFIGEVIKKQEITGKDTFLFGFEESYGYLKGTYARDKDSIVASMLLCEMAAYYKRKNKTLHQAMQDIYSRYGYYVDCTDNIGYGEDFHWKETIASLMQQLRDTPPAELGGEKVIGIRDYQEETITNLTTKEVRSTGLPKSNVLYYETESNDVIVIRPSGTEPKVKIYFLAHGATKAEAEKKVAAYRQSTTAWK